MRAYDECYLLSAMTNLAIAFDYAINERKIKPDQFVNDFLLSKYSKLFEDGAPHVVVGMSGYELVHQVYQIDEKIKVKVKSQISPQFWLGYYLAYYQWESAKRFKDIFLSCSYDQLISMYSVYHEMDVTKFAEALNRRIKTKENNYLKALRSVNQLSQSELANKSGVNKHMIQLYEQGVNDLNKAQVDTLYRLAKALHCQIEDLLVDPLKR